MLGYPSDVTDAEWALLAPFFARPDPRGNPGKYAKRDVVNAADSTRKRNFVMFGLHSCFLA